MRKLLALLVLLSVGVAQGQVISLRKDSPEPPVAPVVPAPAPVATDPVAVLVGPVDTVAPGAYVRIKITGTIGDDPKLTVIPAVKNMDLVTFADGSYGVTAQLSDAGAYTFFLGVNKSGKTAITTLTLSVKAPEPPPVPDADVIKLQDAYKLDGGPADKKVILVALCRQMAKEKVGTWKELADLMSTTGKSMFKDTELIATRKAVVEVMIEKFGTKNGPVNVSIQEKTFNGIADILSAAN